MTLREARRKNKMPQKRLEQLTGINQSIISNIEKGWVKPRSLMIKIFEKALNLKQGELEFSLNNRKL